MAASQNARDVGTARNKAAFDKLNDPLLLKANTAAATTAENTAAKGTNDLAVQNDQLKNIDQLNASNDAATPETLGLAGPFQNLDSIKAALRIRNERAKTDPQIEPMQLRDYILKLQNASQDAALDTRTKAAAALTAENTATFGPKMSQADLDNKNDTNNNLVTTGKEIKPLADATIAQKDAGKFTPTTVGGQVTPFDTHTGKFGVPGGLAPVKGGGTAGHHVDPAIIEQQAQEAVSTIDDMLADPNMGQTVGLSLRRPGSLFGKQNAPAYPGTNAVDYSQKVAKLKGYASLLGVPEFQGLGRFSIPEMTAVKDALTGGISLDQTLAGHIASLKNTRTLLTRAANGQASPVSGNVGAGIAAPSTGGVQKWGRDAQGNPVPLP